MSGSLRSPAKPTLAVLVIPQRTEVVPAADVLPVHVRKVEFGVDRLPDHEIRESLVAGFHHQVGGHRKDQVLLDVGLLDILGVELAGVDGLGELSHRGRELVFATQPDAHLNGGVDTLVGPGTPNRHRQRRFDALEPCTEPRDGFFVEDADVDDHAFGAELDRPVQQGLQGGVPAVEQVPFGEDHGDGLRERGVAVPEAGGEVGVVQTHDSA